VELDRLGPGHRRVVVPGATLSDLLLAAKAFEILPSDPERAVGVLQELCR
jgi:hypothetical protein